MMKQYLMLVFWLLPLGVFAQSDNFRVEVATQGCMFYSVTRLKEALGITSLTASL